MTSDQACFSVVLCCYNSALRLPTTLGHLAQQKVGAATPWEVVLVDNASTDGTADVARTAWTNLGSPVPLRIVPESTPGLTHARLKGLSAAHGPILVFVDDDNWLARDYCARAHDMMAAHPEIGALGGLASAHPEVDPPDWFTELQGAYAIGPQGARSGDITDAKPHLTGAGLVVRRAAFQDLVDRGFAFQLADRTGGSTISGGDTELCYALAIAGHRIWYDEGLRFTHFIPEGRLTRSYVERLLKGLGSSADVTALYESVLRRPSSGWLDAYARNLYRHSKWLMRALVRWTTGATNSTAVATQWDAFRDSITSVGTLMRLFSLHHERLRRLRGTLPLERS
jgi:glycosyltransferase involved in cell wall biosynthesis